MYLDELVIETLKAAETARKKNQNDVQICQDIQEREATIRLTMENTGFSSDKAEELFRQDVEALKKRLDKSTRELQIRTEEADAMQRLEGAMRLDRESK